MNGRSEERDARVAPDDGAAGARLFSSRQPRPATPNPTGRLRPADRMRTAVPRILMEQIERIAATRPGAAEGRDPEFLHDLRVATRRLRFALRLLAPYLPRREADRLRERLGALTLPMEEVRDLDVLLAALPRDLAEVEAEDEVANRVLRRFADIRRAAQDRLARTLVAPSTRRLLHDLERLSSSRQGVPAHRPDEERAAVVGARSIRRLGRKLLRRSTRSTRRLDPVQLHGLRIAARRFRYACEFFAGALGARHVRAVRHAAIAVQDCLGDHQDDTTAIELLRAAAAAPERRADERVAFVLGALAQVRRTRRARRVEELPALWRDLRRHLRRFLRRIGGD